MKNIIIEGIEYNLIKKEKTINRDYEILSVITNNSKFIEKVYNQAATIEPYWKILSVKRLSDSEIFTLNDSISLFNQTKFFDKIKSFEIVHNTIFIYFKNQKSNINIHSICKFNKQKLLTTFDNVDIYEGDSYWYIQTGQNNGNTHGISKYIGELRQYIGSSTDIIDLLNTNIVRFSTKQAAQDYIKSKKVFFTTEDGVDIIEGNKFVWVDDDYKMNYLTASKYTPNNIIQNSFSIKKAAEDYIILNKPCLSLNDVGQFYKKLLDFSNGNSKGLLELVKSKL